MNRTVFYFIRNIVAVLGFLFLVAALAGLSLLALNWAFEHIEMVMYACCIALAACLTVEVVLICWVAAEKESE